MSDIRPGIYKIGNLQIVMFSDEIIGVGYVGKGAFADQDMTEIRRDIRLHFPNAKTVIIAEGPVSYEDLMKSDGFREAVTKITSEAISAAFKAAKSE